MKKHGSWLSWLINPWTVLVKNTFRQDFSSDCVRSSSSYPCMVRRRVDFLLPCCCPHWHGAHPFIFLAGKTTRSWNKFLRGCKGRECTRRREGKKNYSCFPVLLLFLLLHLQSTVSVFGCGGCGSVILLIRLAGVYLWARYWAPDGCTIGVWGACVNEYRNIVGCFGEEELCCTRLAGQHLAPLSLAYVCGKYCKVLWRTI